MYGDVGLPCQHCAYALVDLVLEHVRPADEIPFALDDSGDAGPGAGESAVLTDAVYDLAAVVGLALVVD